MESQGRVTTNVDTERQILFLIPQKGQGQDSTHFPWKKIMFWLKNKKKMKNLISQGPVTMPSLVFTMLIG